MAEGDNDAKTEAATPARLLKAIDHGEMPLARELPGALGLLAFIGVLIGFGAPLIDQLIRALAGIIAEAGAPGGFHHALMVLLAASREPVHMIGLVGGAVIGASLLGTIAQTGFRPRLQAPRLHVSMLSPLTGLSRLLSANHLIETLRSTIKLIIVGIAVTLILKARLPALIGTIATHPASITLWIGKTLLAIVSAVALGNLIIAAADLGWTRLRFQSQIKMTHTEIRDESRETHGNPEVKARLRALRAARAKQTLSIALARASVVVTNPTHYAVALEYNRGDQSAPRIVAKGKDRMAARIRELARELSVPIVANPPLARALYKVALEAEIPAEHFKIVAEIIAYVWRLAERMQPIIEQDS